MGAIDELISKINYLNIEKSKREIFNKLKNSVIFKDSRGNPDIFLLSMILGFKHGKPKKLSNSSNLFRINELEKDIWIALSIGFSEMKDIHIFESKEGARAALKVCEEYANAGIDILNDLMKKPEDFILNLIEDILEK
jgi:hypothetical protein